MADFDPKSLNNKFSNLQLLPDCTDPTYVVLDAIGNQVGTIIYYGNHHWSYYRDNFPLDKKYFDNNLPVHSLEMLVADIQRTGLHLIPVQ